MAGLTGKENAACEAFILHKGDKVKAYTDAGYSTRMSKAAVAVQADKLFNKPKITLKIRELQKLATSEFIWTKEKKLKILQDVVESCSKEDDEKGMLNAAAVVSAMKEHNIMQGDNAPTKVDNLSSDGSMAVGKHLCGAELDRELERRGLKLPVFDE